MSVTVLTSQRGIGPNADPLQLPSTGASSRHALTAALMVVSFSAGGAGAGGAGGAGAPHHSSIAEMSHPACSSFAAFAPAHTPQLTGSLRSSPHSACSAVVQVAGGGANATAERASSAAQRHASCAAVSGAGLGMAGVGVLNRDNSAYNAGALPAHTCTHIRGSRGSEGRMPAFSSV
eukprot:SAG25_NODE_1485_length_2931_cov_1.939619_4_plen_177_part_00